ncbi:glycosyltransferase family 2 protein [Flavobacterium sp. LHD-80]|uniref:glycosyltransferase family 2 protein n=1 Tax=Flavobacterium sp. LHD-80 TaxID=3071411 RepID=UPI0027E070BF|nr:glycosyltransferase family 2 protein [Flavobacterium sp. LHD-80]MDQ6472081.1 glycosyltransferase family 2 protein [Flavobacterium sp. LHD-80]
MLAIVIPYFNLLFFEETLKSLANQTDKRFKVYIGDDASPDNPKQLIEKYKGRFNLDYFRFQSNLGSISLTRQWERCIDLTENEEWIMILGDDDVLGKNVVEEFYKKKIEFDDKSNVVRFATKIINEKSGTVSESFLHPKWETASDSFCRKANFLTRSSLSEYLFSKKIYTKYKFRTYPLAWHSDDMAWIDFCEQKLIFTINESLVFIRESNVSISGKRDNKILKNKASVLFMTDLITEKLVLFTKNQTLHLLLIFEIEIKKYRKISFKEYLFLLKFYFKNFSLIHLSKLIRRILIHRSKKKIKN